MRHLGAIAVLVGLASFSSFVHAQVIYHADRTQSTPAVSADGNSDGWPDNPFAALGNGDLWLSTGGPRTVAALRWSDDDETQTIDLEVPRPGYGDQRILIESPGTLAALGEIAVMLVGVAPDLESLLGVTEAGGMAAYEGATLLPGGQYVEISVLISDDGGTTYDELDPARLQNAPILLRMEDFSVGVDAFPVLYEHPTYVGSQASSGIALLAEPGTWTATPCITLPHDERVKEDAEYPAYIEAMLRSLSVFAPLDGVATSVGNGETGNGGDGDTDSTVETTGTGSNPDSESLNEEMTIEEILSSGTGENTGEESQITAEGGNGGGEQSALLLQPGDPVWADFGYKGTEKGTEKSPFNSLGEAVFAAAVLGSNTIKIDRVTPNFGSAETLTIATPLTIEAVNGPVRIGQATRVLYMSFTQWGAVTFDPVGTPMEGELPYAVNPEYRVYDDGDVVLLDAYPADGLRFKAWWSPNTDFTEEVTAADLLPSTKHRVAMNRDRFVWALYEPNTENYDLTDTDADGLAAYRETEFSTSSTDDDSDDDGLPDGWEVNYALNPLSGAEPDGPTGDPDDDSVTNLDEFIAGTSPRFNESAPPPPDEPPPSGASPPNLDDLNPDFSHTDFSTATGITYSGNAALYGTQIRLVPQGGNHAGAIWTTNKMPVSKGFSTTFSFDLNDGASDGISFVIQNSSPTPALSTGGLMGYEGIVNSIAVELDTFQNIENNDPPSQNLGIHTGGSNAPNNADESFSLASQLVGFLLGGNDLRIGIHSMTVTYDPNSQTLSARIDDKPPLTISIDLETALDLDDGKAYVGIMSTSGDPEYTNGPNYLESWSADFITSPAKAELRNVRVHGSRGDTGIAIAELDNQQPTFEEYFDGGFTEWGQPDAFPYQLENQQNSHPERGEYPRSFDVFFNEVVQAVPNDNVPGTFVIWLDAAIEGNPGISTYNWIWEVDPTVAGQFIHVGSGAVLDFLGDPTPGLYTVRCEARLPSESSAPPHRTVVAHVLLPYAGPEILDWLLEEARQIARPGGIGDQWIDHVNQQAGSFSATIPGFPQLQQQDFRRRAFFSVSWNWFDYIGHMTFNGDWPTHRFEFEDLQRATYDPLYQLDNKPFNDPSYATFQGLVISRQKITDALWAVWARTNGYSETGMIAGANFANILAKRQLDDKPTNNAYRLGSRLYEDIRINDLPNPTIIDTTLTQERARSIQVGETINDVRLWPRSDFVAPPHTELWTNTNDELDDGRTWTRPTIFLPLAEMDLNLLTP